MPSRSPRPIFPPARDARPAGRHRVVVAALVATPPLLAALVWLAGPGERSVAVRIDLVVVALGALIAANALLALVVLRRRRLRLDDERLRVIVSSLHEGLIYFDRSLNIIEINQAATDALGAIGPSVTEDIRAMTTWRSIHDDGTPWPFDQHPVSLTIATGQPIVGAVMGVERDGETTRWLRLNTQPVSAGGDRVDGVVLTFRDITNERAAQAALRSSEARFAALVERGSDIICVLDADGVVTYASPATARVLGSGPLAVGTSFVEVLHPSDAESATEVFAAVAAETGSVDAGELRVQDRSGRWHHLEVVIANRLDDPDIAGVVANIRDVSDRAAATDALTWQAFHDQLTGLANRARLVEALEEALERSQRLGSTTALLFLDLDRFKNVNDTMGHEAGDRLLVEVASRLRNSVRPGDLVARLGGDEFVVLAESLPSRDAATQLADRVREAIARPIDLKHGPVTLTTSVGVAFDDGHAASALLRDADIALYRAKDRGRDRWAIFDDSLRADAIRRVAAEQLIRRALDEDGLRIHYQPIVDLTTGVVVGAEALLRIVGPHGDLLTPGSFIAIAEDTGLIVPVGAGVLDDACRELARWRTELGEAAPRSLSVNLSAKQLSTGSFAELVARTLERHRIDAGSLTLELTESTLIEAGRAALDTVEDLHEMGVRLAIDDFGTGYSSLAYLKRFPVDIVKVDRTFVDGLGRVSSDTEIVRAVLALGQSLGLMTVAEGVETTEQLAALQDLGCDYAQGYLLGHPVPGDQMVDAVRRQLAHPTHR